MNVWQRSTKEAVDGSVLHPSSALGSEQTPTEAIPFQSRTSGFKSLSNYEVKFPEASSSARFVNSVVGPLLRNTWHTQIWSLWKPAVVGTFEKIRKRSGLPPLTCAYVWDEPLAFDGVRAKESADACAKLSAGWETKSRAFERRRRLGLSERLLRRCEAAQAPSNLNKLHSAGPKVNHRFAASHI